MDIDIAVADAADCAVALQDPMKLPAILRDHNNPPELVADDTHLVAVPAFGEFDYTTLADEAVCKAVHAEALAIRDNLKQERSARWDIGKRLLHVKDMLNHGQFGDWIRLEFGMSSTTASRYMALARRLTFDKFCTVQNLSAATQYALASRATPATVLDQIIEGIKRGDLGLGHDRQLDDRVMQVLQELKADASVKPGKRSKRAFEDEVWAKEAVKFLRQYLGSSRYNAYKRRLQRTSPKRFYEVAIAEKPSYNMGIVTCSPVNADGRPLDGRALVGYLYNRDTTPIPTSLSADDGTPIPSI